MSIPKSDINRLNVTELTHELAIRGLKDVGNVVQMRKTLRTLLKVEKSDNPLTYPTYPFSFDDDKAALEAKHEEITILLGEFEGIAGTLHDKILAKLNFALRHANSSIPTTQPEKDEKFKYIVKFLGLRSDFDSKVKRHNRRLLNDSLGAPDLDLVDVNDSSEDEASEEEAVSVQHQSFVAPSSKTVPISKWNIKFSGESTGISLSAFLIRIEELKHARGATNEDLYQSAIDLFEGKALIYYRAMKKQATNWTSLVTMLRKEFQPPDFNDRLFEEIKVRTQGPQESMGMFVASLENMFDRLTISVPPSTRLKIMLKNISPFYQTQLGLHKIATKEELMDLGKLVEARKIAVDNFQPPPRRSSGRLLEPDLAYASTYEEVHEVTSRNPIRDSNRNPMTCWNCRKEGHSFQSCPATRQKFCFRCGKPNVTVRNCSKCSPSENCHQRF